MQADTKPTGLDAVYARIHADMVKMEQMAKEARRQEIRSELLSLLTHPGVEHVRA